ncbi:MAG: geranylgeranylglycerol-phosphate geranylgeranyltransferase [Candidatus Eisenbacteria bacterium]
MKTRTSSGRESGSGSRSATLIGLLRPANGVIAGAAVLVGAFVSASSVEWGAAVLGALAALAATGAANALNDSRDVESDLVNRPGRPLPQGRVSPAAALILAFGLYAASLILVYPLGGSATLLVGAWIVLTALYSFALKGVPLFGNLVVAFVAASPLLMGGATQGVAPYRPGPAALDAMATLPGHRLLILFFLAALLHMARELVKDAEDVEGDRSAGTRTFAVVAGVRSSVSVARVLLVASMWAAAAPFAMRLLGWGYLALLVPIEGALVWLLVESSRALREGGDGPSLRRVSNGLKIVMVLGLAAFAAGAV